MKPAALALALLAATVQATAQAQLSAPAGDPALPVVRLTVSEAVARAIAASPRLARLAALEAAAAAQSRGTRAERWPQLELAAGYQRRSDVPELTITLPATDLTSPPQRLTVFPNLTDNWRTRAALALPVYTGGRVERQIEAASHSRVASTEDLRAGRADLVLETTTACWSLVTARENEHVLREAIRAYEAHASDSRNRERFGLAARNEVLAVEVEQDRVELDRLRAEAAAEIAQANLRRLLDLPPSTRVEIGEALTAEVSVEGELEALVAEASAARAERKALAARVASADAAARAERGARLPQLALNAGYTYANPNRDIVPSTAAWKDSWDVGASVSWNVLDGGRRAANEARTRAQADAARELLRELDRGIRLEVTQRVLELRTARARVAVAEHSVASAAESRRVAGDRYKEGVLPSSELLDAEVAQERAQLARTEALASLRLGAAALTRALGR